MAVRRFAVTLAGASTVDKSAVVKSSPGGTLTGSNIIELNAEDTGASKHTILLALETVRSQLLADTWPPA